MIKNSKGQLSIFMGITLILVMGMLAFIVNVGLFVKAKINLQNAVDAAAFSGAATQARQLTNIAYVNWELRNTFKEWMFKYYVLGQLGLAAEGGNPAYNLSEQSIAGNGTVNFLLRNPGLGSGAGINPSDVQGSDWANNFDRYNVPSICIHNNSSTNICPIYALPGIPRFPALGVAGISEIHEAFVNKLVEAKGANCSDRTQINYLAASAWAFSSGIKNVPGAPLIATNRPGAWTQALELGMRIRNLEMIVNRPPVSEPIDITKMIDLQSDIEGLRIGYNERPIKAYTSALRNLGGGKYKDQMDGSSRADESERDELALSFKLTEIPPQPFNAAPGSLSGFLIPQDNDALNKYYLDLEAMTVNYAPLFTMFATTQNQFEPTVTSEASCYVSKTALPVPGYLLGFAKNPNVLTYYAVKGEAEFTGLFFPRNSDDQPASFTLTAYAAAKPFGGRIGPMLFYPDNGTITARKNSDRKSMAYFSGFDIGAAALNNVNAGAPIPPNFAFWVNKTVTDSIALGGVPEATGGAPSFGIPNMMYDIDNEGSLASQSSGSSVVQVIQRSALVNSPGPEDNKGLYEKSQFRSLKRSLGVANPGVSMNSDDVMRALIRARRVTRYDVVNYLVPHYKEIAEGSNAAPFLQRVAVPDGITDSHGYYYKIFAPLAGPKLLYRSGEFAKSIASTFKFANKAAIDNYLNVLKDVAQAIYNLPSQGGSSINLQAAKSIHINSGPDYKRAEFPPMEGDDVTSSTCYKDMASKFNHFFYASVTACGIVPLELLVNEYINKQMEGDKSYYYYSTYYNDLDSGNDPKTVMTAYHPGLAQGASPDALAIASHPLNLNIAGSSSYSTLRNYYSTKFIQLSNVFANSKDKPGGYGAKPLLRESDKNHPEDFLSKADLLNPINASMSNIDGAFFLDF